MPPVLPKRPDLAGEGAKTSGLPEEPIEAVGAALSVFRNKLLLAVSIVEKNVAAFEEVDIVFVIPDGRNFVVRAHTEELVGELMACTRADVHSDGFVLKTKLLKERGDLVAVRCGQAGVMKACVGRGSAKGTYGITSESHDVCSRTSARSSAISTRRRSRDAQGSWHAWQKTRKQ